MNIFRSRGVENLLVLLVLPGKIYITTRLTRYSTRKCQTFLNYHQNIGHVKKLRLTTTLKTIARIFDRIKKNLTLRPNMKTNSHC
jgi:hypothetical protein